MKNSGLWTKFTTNFTYMGAFSALFLSLSQFPDPTQASQVQPDQQQVTEVVEAQLPRGYNTSIIIRDPFAAPNQFRPQPTVSVAPVNGRSQQAETMRPVKPTLKGIVGAGNAKVAILAVNAESRSYRVNEHVGAYIITAITNNFVTLQGPDGTTVVPMGR